MSNEEDRQRSDSIRIWWGDGEPDTNPVDASVPVNALPEMSVQDAPQSDPIAERTNDVTVFSTNDSSARSREHRDDYERQLLQQALEVGDFPAVNASASVGVLVLRQTPQQVRRGHVFALRADRTVVGRGMKAALLLDDPGVASYHAVINHEIRDGIGVFVIYPLGCSPVEVSGQVLENSSCLAHGDSVRIGASELVFFQVGFGAESV
jgi:hypothetical protein